MKAEELRDLSHDELFNVKVKRATGQLENTALAQKLRRDIARVESVLSEKLGASQ